MNLYDQLKACIDDNIKSPDKHVYHYTTEYGYCEIVRCGYLKLSSHLFLNDKDKLNQELQVGIDLIIAKLKENENDSLLEKFEKFITAGIVYYVTSFSKRRSVFIARKYGNFCIEFNSAFLNKYTSHKSTLFSNVVYDSLKQQNIVNQLFDIYESYEGQSELSDFVLFLVMIIPLFKSDMHKNDEECRIVQAEIFAPDTKKLVTPLTTKKIPFTEKDIHIYRE